ncbi:uroporphyrinogen-III synthase [Leifsonia bigeumensis]|uniref:Uroporphyrinogen-III synthase n=1 Tax=Leifsonella bigeumensis TaxID=433643 RepID=A0ABP7F198_9MICO
MTSAIAGWRVLVPRGGPWGRAVANRLVERGAIPVIAPLIEFAPTEDAAELAAGLERLAAGDFDWLVVTSATTVGLLEGVEVPATTRIAAVGSATADALAEAGLRVDFVPSADFSADALVSEWPGGAGSRIFLPQSAIAEPTAAEGLRAAGNRVDAVAAYRTIGARVAPETVAEVRSGGIRAILVTSGSVAREVAAQLAPISPGTVIACIGPRTAAEARAVGLDVDAIAERQSIEALILSIIHSAEVRP